LGDDLPVLCSFELVDGRCYPEGPPDGHRCSPRSLSKRVESGSVQVPGRILHGTDPIPQLEQAEERILHHLLGFMAVAGDQAESPEQRRALGLEEVLEARRIAHGLRYRDPSARHEPERSAHPLEKPRTDWNV